MTPNQAHRVPPCGGSCATCRRTARRDRMLALAVIAVFALVFLLHGLVLA